MQVSVENSTALERRVTVEVPEDQIAEQVKTRLNELCRTARIDGFRAGRAPLSVIRQRFGRRVRDEIVGDLMQQSFSEALTQQELRPAGQPVIDPVAAKPGEGLTYTATFEVYPDIQIAPVESISLERVKCEIDDADIDTMIDRLREQNREWLTVERAAADGDKLAIDFAGSIDGEAFEGGSGEDFDLALGTGMMIDGFEDGLRGKSAGDEVELDLQFPEDYRNTELAGKPVKFKITVKKVTEGVLPEVDAEFIRKFGVESGELDAFREDVRKNMEKERDRAVHQRFNSEVMEKLAEANDFEVPASLVSGESDRMRQDVARELIMRGVNPADAGHDMDAEVAKRAKTRVKLGLLMAEIIKQAELRADPDKVRRMLEDMASSYEDPAAVVKYYYDNPEHLQQVEGLCLEDEVVNWVANQAQVVEQTVSFDALMNPVQTGEEVEASS